MKIDKSIFMVFTISEKLMFFRNLYIYTRVSTAMQIDGYSLEAQKTRMKGFCAYNEYEIAGEYEDAGKLMISVLSAVAEIECTSESCNSRWCPRGKCLQTVGEGNGKV